MGLRKKLLGRELHPDHIIEALEYPDALCTLMINIRQNNSNAAVIAGVHAILKRITTPRTKVILRQIQEAKDPVGYVIQLNNNLRKGFSAAKRFARRKPTHTRQ